MTPETSREERARTLSRMFDLLRDETRCEIVLTLASLSTTQWSGNGVRFSELRAAVDVSDGGRFNYHLGKLRGSLVELTGDTYHLTGDGYAMTQAIRSVQATGDSSAAGVTGTCPDCGADIRTSCEDGFVSIECSEHGVLFDMYLPPAVVDAHDPASIETYAGIRAQWYVELAMHGACAECWGPVDRRTPVPLHDTTLEPEGTTGAEPTVEFTCAGCNTTYWLPPGVCVLRHPAVVSFCYEELDRDVLRGTYYDFEVCGWDYPHIEGDDHGVSVRLDGNDRSLLVRLDDGARVVKAEPVPGAPSQDSPSGA